MDTGGAYVSYSGRPQAVPLHVFIVADTANVAIPRNDVCAPIGEL